MGRSHFGDQEHVVAATIQRVADQLLGRAVAVHLARLDQGHAEIEPELERRHFGIPVLGILAQACGPLPEHRNRLAEWKLEPPDGRGRHAASFLWTQHAACVRVRPTGKALSPARKVAQTRPRRLSLARGQVLSQYAALRRGRCCRRFRRRSYVFWRHRRPDAGEVRIFGTAPSSRAVHHRELVGGPGGHGIDVEEVDHGLA